MVDFTLTDENKLVADSARAFAEAEILPNIRDWDRGDGYPRAMLDKLAEQGFLGAPIPLNWIANDLSGENWLLMGEPYYRRTWRLESDFRENEIGILVKLVFDL